MKLEAATGFEPVNNGFAGRDLYVASAAHSKEEINSLTVPDLCHHSSKSATDADYQPVLDEKGLCFEIIFYCDKIVTEAIEKQGNR